MKARRTGLLTYRRKTYSPRLPTQYQGSDINANFVPAYSCEGSVDSIIELPDIRACTFDTGAVSINYSWLSSTYIQILMYPINDVENLTDLPSNFREIARRNR